MCTNGSSSPIAAAARSSASSIRVRATSYPSDTLHETTVPDERITVTALLTRRLLGNVVRSPSSVCSSV